jgi:YD repeat-containing protein
VDNQSTPFAWVQGVTYGPADELRQLGGFGGETRTYNSLLQMTRLTVSGGPDVEYNYSATLNNGRIVQSVDHTTGEAVTYGYDSLNRLTSANASASTLGAAWGSTYAYDGFGNLTNKTPTLGSASAAT